MKNLNLHVRKVFLQPAVDISSLATYTSLTPVRRSIINIRGIIKFMINDCPIEGSFDGDQFIEHEKPYLLVRN